MKAERDHHLGAPPTRRAIPEPWAIAIPAVLFGLLDFSILRQDHRSSSSALGGSVAMAAFVAVGVWWIRRTLRRVRAKSAGGPVASGGWANPTGRQRFVHRLTRLLRRPGADERANPLTGTRPNSRRKPRP